MDHPFIEPWQVSEFTSQEHRVRRTSNRLAIDRQGARRMDWRHRSACLDEDPELFFPIGNTGPAILQIEEAKQVCRRCDVQEQCLAWALESGQDHGVWGGMSEDERRALKRRNARARIRTA
jgi:WhiB family redox-sensing transcriptional regulator